MTNYVKNINLDLKATRFWGGDETNDRRCTDFRVFIGHIGTLCIKFFTKASLKNMKIHFVPRHIILE